MCKRFLTPLMAGLQSSPYHFPPPRPQHTHQKKKKETPTREETAERGVSKGGCVAKMSAQMRKVGGGRGQLAPGEEDTLQLQTVSRKAGLFKAEGRGCWKGTRAAKMTTRERRAEFGALL